MGNKNFKLKDLYSPELVKNYAQRMKGIWLPFTESKFIAEVLNAQWEDLELKERMRRVSTCLRSYLPDDYQVALKMILISTHQLIDELGEKMIFEYGFIADFVERFGLQHLDESINAMKIITRLTSCEFAVRPYLKKYPETMYPKMMEWAHHESPLVRRLATEGFRPRLPWGMGIPVLKKDPSPMLPILELLKSDPAETVRRSVANHLNDISKDHPEIVIEIVNRWFGHDKNTDWVVKHACRGLLKAGHQEVMHLFGFDSNLHNIKVLEFTYDPTVQVGGTFHFSFSVTNRRKDNFKTRLEYMIQFLTSTGKKSKKVFYIRELIMAPEEKYTFKRKQRFQDMTTRKHYPGEHDISLLLNGKVMAKAQFEVTIS